MAPFKRLRTGIARRLFPDRERFREPIRDTAGRRAAWFDFLFVDFGILRLFWKNRAQIAPRAWRMNQPYPGDIDWAARNGIRTIVTARHDPRHGGHALVAEACARHGLAYETFADTNFLDPTYFLFSRAAPSREVLLATSEFFAKIEHPVLLHCKSGADRAGLLSALYLIVAERVPVRDARKQLSMRFLHFSASRTGILDALFEAYLATHPNEAVPFLDWVAKDYDPAALTRNFRHHRFWDFLERSLLRRE